jgi:Secretion system C-terminal sorting domain
MKQLLLLVVMTFVITGLQAQKNRNKQDQKTQGYAITASEKGGRGWKEVRFVNMITGEELKSIYQSSQEAEPLNARTGKPIVKAESKAATSGTSVNTPVRKVVDLDQELDKMNNNGRVRHVVVVRHSQHPVQSDKPFATNSAAAAYDKKHERLYYTPMGINQLRYIDLKSGKIYFFEDEPFGVVKGMGDSPKQITRMVIASDGNGYALTNDAKNLIRFTTGKKPEISDLGALTDDGANGRYSVHSGSGFGGDIIADASGNLYLFTANRNIFKINIESKVATYKGTIKGLPQGFSTNGAMVEEGSKVIVASSESTVGYYRVDLNTMQAEQITSQGEVYNASDLANGNLAFSKQKKEKKPKEVKEEPAVVATTQPKAEENAASRSTQMTETGKGTISVYPNPVTEGSVKLQFNDQPLGQYQVQLLDVSGKLISTKGVNVTFSGQIEEFRFPELNVKGNYFIKVTSELHKVSEVSKIVVQ